MRLLLTDATLNMMEESTTDVVATPVQVDTCVHVNTSEIRLMLHMWSAFFSCCLGK